ncbi:hypothetical protein ACVI1J_002933 [Bradyrhizobium diazoefficiens]
MICCSNMCIHWPVATLCGDVASDGGQPSPLGLAGLATFAPEGPKIPPWCHQGVSLRRTGSTYQHQWVVAPPRACHIKVLGLQMFELAPLIGVTAVPRTEVVAAIQAFTDYARRPSHTPAEDTYAPQRTEEQLPFGDPGLKLSAQEWTRWRIALFRPYPNSRRSDARWGQIFPQRTRFTKPCSGRIFTLRVDGCRPLNQDGAG